MDFFYDLCFCLFKISFRPISIFTIICPRNVARIPNPTNRLHQPNPIRLARHTSSKHASSHNQHNTSRLCRLYPVFLLFSLSFAICFCLSACFSRSNLFRHDLAADLQCFSLSGCLLRPRVLPSGDAAGSARTLGSILPLKGRRSLRLLFCCCVSFLCL